MGGAGEGGNASSSPVQPVVMASITTGSSRLPLTPPSSHMYVPFRRTDVCPSAEYSNVIGLPSSTSLPWTLNRNAASPAHSPAAGMLGTGVGPVRMPRSAPSMKPATVPSATTAPSSFTPIVRLAEVGYAPALIDQPVGSEPWPVQAGAEAQVMASITTGFSRLPMTPPSSHMYDPFRRTDVCPSAENRNVTALPSSISLPWTLSRNAASPAHSPAAGMLGTDVAPARTPRSVPPMNAATVPPTATPPSTLTPTVRLAEVGYTPVVSDQAVGSDPKLA